MKDLAPDTEPTETIGDANDLPVEHGIHFDVLEIDISTKPVEHHLWKGPVPATEEVDHQATNVAEIGPGRLGGSCQALQNFRSLRTQFHISKLSKGSRNKDWSKRAVQPQQQEASVLQRIGFGDQHFEHRTKKRGLTNLYN